MSETTNPFNIPDYVPDLSPKAKGVVAAAPGLDGPTPTIAALAQAAEVNAAGETAEQRSARLRAAAQIEIDKERDAEEVSAIVAAERQRRAQELLPTDSSGFPAEYVKVTIFKGQGKHDLSYVPLGINGFCIKAPRGIQIILPKIFVDECLEHAIEEVTEQSQGGLITRPVHRFPYNLHGVATKAEYQAFMVEQKALAERQTTTARMSA